MGKNEREERLVLEAGDAARVQRDQLFRAEEQIGQMRRALDKMSLQGEGQDHALEEMMAWMAAAKNDPGTDTPGLAQSITPYEAAEVQADIQQTRIVPLTQEDSWEKYLESVEWYARLERLNLSSDPYMSLMSKQEQEAFVTQVHEDYYERKAQCDAIDYALAAFCGTVAGLVDIFLVGTPGDSVLGKWTDAQTDKFVITIAKKLGWNPHKENEDSVGHAIGWLENRFEINYDFTNDSGLHDAQNNQISKEIRDALSEGAPLSKIRYKIGKTAQGYIGLSTKNHHIKSLAHSPDLVGLIFSILDQLRGEARFVDRGRVVVFKVGNELHGSTLSGKIIAGFVNWLGHCISDVAGSNNSRKRGNRGMGLPMPGFELYQFIPIGKIGEDQLSLADFTVKMFENGYDYRFGLALSIPVAINEIMVRLSFALKRYFYHHLPLAECIPVNLKVKSVGIRQPELRRMMLIAHGTMCVWDAGDALVAYVTSSGDALNAALHLNYFAYIRLAQAGLSTVRAVYRQTHIDLYAITKDTKEEWDRLYLDAQKWSPAALSEDEAIIDALPSTSMVE